MAWQTMSLKNARQVKLSNHRRTEPLVVMGNFEETRMDELCRTCHFFYHILPDPEWVAREWGECRVLSPRAEHGVIGSWPIIIADDWCGQWKERNKELPEPVRYDCRDINPPKSGNTGKKAFCGFHQLDAE